MAGTGEPPAAHLGSLRTITAGLWTVAMVVMGVSATTAEALLTQHGMQPAQGIALGLAVDAAIVVALVGDRMLHQVGRRSSWGTALRWITVAMSLLLNCAGSFIARDTLGVTLHAIPSVLLMVLAEASQSYRMQLHQGDAQPATSPITTPVPAPVLARPVPAQPVPASPVPAPTARPVGTGGTGTASTGTAASTAPTGTGVRVSTGSPARQDRSAGTELTVVRTPARPAAATGTAGGPGDWDAGLWQRAVALARQYRAETGRDITVDQVQKQLAIGRNRAVALRRDVLAHLEEAAA